MAAIIHEERQVDGLSFKAPSSTHAEEMAIALAASHPDSKFILTGSRGTCRNFHFAWITPLADKIRDCDPTHPSIIWVPGHEGMPDNEANHEAARALTYRAPGITWEDLDPDHSPPLSFKDITEHYIVPNTGITRFL